MDNINTVAKKAGYRKHNVMLNELCETSQFSRFKKMRK